MGEDTGPRKGIHLCRSVCWTPGCPGSGTFPHVLSADRHPRHLRLHLSSPTACHGVGRVHRRVNILGSLPAWPSAPGCI